MNKRGSVLVHVLITTVIVIVIATGLAQMLMMRYAATIRATSGVQNRRDAEGSLARFTSDWNSQPGNGFCHSPGGGLNCSGITTTCSACTCTITGTVSGTLTASGTYPNCKISITSTAAP